MDPGRGASSTISALVAADRLRREGARKLARRLPLGIAVAATLALGSPAAALGVDAIRPLVGFQPGALSVAAGPAGDVYLSNPEASAQVQRFTSDGALVGAWGNFGTSAGPGYSRALATDAAGNVHVMDDSSDRLQVFTADGTPIGQWSSSGRDVAIDAAGDVYVVGDSRVERFAPDGSLVAAWGGSGEGDGQLSEPWGLDTGASGYVYVADTYRNRVQVFTPDGSFVGKWGGYGSGEGQFRFPYGIATGPAGNVYVADTANNRVQKFTATGGFVGGWGSSGRRPGQFYTPTSVATDPAGNVYVADAGASYPAAGSARVQKFSPDGRFLAQWRGSPALPRPARPRLFAAVGKRTAKRAAVFRFRSRQPGVRFQCRLTGRRVPRRLRRWRGCDSPKRYARLRPGRKVFHVRAVKDAEPGEQAWRSWRILKR